MKYKIYMMGAMLLMTMLTACHEDSDNLLAYDQVDELAFSDARNSYAGKFKVMWNGLNQYYALWDYEKENGLDWDAVYDEYLPQFEALDKRDKDNPVTDEELTEMLRKVLSPLHDGHFCMVWQNHATGKTVGYCPSNDRRTLRDDAEAAKDFVPSLLYYVNNDEIVADDNGELIMSEGSTLWTDIKSDFWNTPGIGMMWIEAQLKSLEEKENRTEMQEYYYANLNQLYEMLDRMKNVENPSSFISTFNNLASQYAVLGVPGLKTIDTNLIENGICVKSALLKGNIAYFYFSGFNLTPYISDGVSSFDMSNPMTAQYVKKVIETWNMWFGMIQLLHKQGALGGVIIDVRSNGGGMMSDAQYVTGAMLPAGGFQYGYSRFKRGTGRYDYSPLLPMYAATMEQEHEIVDDRPVVLLTNCNSVSMAEMTTQVVKLMKNGTVIGKRTHGGLCGLISNEYHSYNYSGHIGVEGQTPVYGYVPSLASFTMDKQQLEGVGISPDIEVDFDMSLFESNGRDTQLERALQFIRSGE